MEDRRTFRHFSLEISNTFQGHSGRPIRRSSITTEAERHLESRVLIVDIRMETNDEFVPIAQHWFRCRLSAVSKFR